MPHALRSFEDMLTEDDVNFLRDCGICVEPAPEEEDEPDNELLDRIQDYLRKRKGGSDENLVG